MENQELGVDFDYDEVVNYKDMVVRIERDIVTKVINVRELVDNCE